jgi:glycerate dehydrogenase
MEEEISLMGTNKIVVLDGYTLNPGDLSWDGLRMMGECEIHDRTPAEKTIDKHSDLWNPFRGPDGIRADT